jgi:hypothetical protein
MSILKLYRYSVKIRTENEFCGTVSGGADADFKKGVYKNGRTDEQNI